MTDPEYCEWEEIRAWCRKHCAGGLHIIVRLLGRCRTMFIVYSDGTCAVSSCAYASDKPTCIIYGRYAFMPRRAVETQRFMQYWIEHGLPQNHWVPPEYAIKTNIIGCWQASRLLTELADRWWRIKAQLRNDYSQIDLNTLKGD